MLPTSRRLIAAAAISAILATPAVPASAADLSRLDPARFEAYDAGADSADGWRRRHRRDNGIDAGDVIAGVLVLGTIAAIAGAVSRDRDRDNRPAPYPQDVRYPDSRYPDDVRSRVPGSERAESRGLDRAVDMCIAEIERGRERVARVDDVGRDADGWNVAGELEGGTPFTCRIGNDGRIEDLSTGGGYGSRSEVADRQYSDETYARLRAAQRGGEAGVEPPYAEPSYDAPSYEASVDEVPVDEDIYGDEPRPAYPGGPLPGEEGYDDSIAARDYPPVG